MARRRPKKPPPPTLVTLENDASRADLLLRAGGSVGSLRLAGREILAAPPIAEVEREYAFRYTLDTFPSNLYLFSGFAVPLFPVAGELPARPLGLDLGEASVFERQVPVPLNRDRRHWHGLAYGARTEVVSADASRAHLRLPAGFFGPYWTGQVQLDFVYTLSDRLRVEMKASNIGPTPVPVMAGVRLALRGDSPYERVTEGVRRGPIEVRAEPLGRVSTSDAVVLSSGEFRALEPDGVFRFAYEISV